MENTKFTQGEWNISKHGNNDSFGIYAEGSGNDLAIVKGGNEEGGEAEANSKLIAAAPAMLYALKTAYETLLNDCNYNGIALDDIEAAINKAIN
jgi:hypothetical protein